MAREDGELRLYSLPILPRAFGMARESSELGLIIFPILPQAFGMARENSKLGLNPGRYRRVSEPGCAVQIFNCDCFKAFWVLENKCPMVSGLI